MTDFKNMSDPGVDAPSTPRTYDFFETLLIALLACAAFLLSGQLAIILTLPGMMDGLSSDQIDALWKQERWQGIGAFVATPAAIAVLWVAIRKAGRGFTEYLALNWPGGGEIVRALAITTIFLSIEIFLLSKMTVDGGYESKPTYVVGNAAVLFVFLIRGCVIAPLIEELVVRGFLFRGWSQSFLRPIGAIVLTSAVWALTHTQYDWFGRGTIFLFGLVLGHLRWTSNSTWTAVVAHSACNTVILFIFGRYV